MIFSLFFFAFYIFFKVAQDLLSEEQSQVFIDMIRDIVKQVKQNPKQTPIVTIPQKYRQVSEIDDNKKLLSVSH